jgi:hypothetical protein
MTAPTDLTEMQCLWFLQEDGDCHRRNGDLGMALKRYQALATVSTVSKVMLLSRLIIRLSETMTMIITISTSIVYVG